MQLEKELNQNLEQDEDPNEAEEEKNRKKALSAHTELYIQVYLFKASVTSLLMIAIQILLYFWSISWINNQERAMAHLNRLSLLKSEVKYLNTLTIESISNHAAITIEGKGSRLGPHSLESNMVEVMGRSISTDLRLLNDDINKNFHTWLSDYNDLLFRVSNENVCKEVFESSSKYGFQSKTITEFV